MATTTCTEIYRERSGIATQNNIVGSNEYKIWQDQRMKIPSTKHEIAEKMEGSTDDYVDYWKKRWNDHPLNIGMGKNKTLQISELDKKHDWQAFVEKYDVIWHYTERFKKTKKMPWRGPPSGVHTKLIWDKHGRKVEVEAPYQTLYKKDVKPDDMFMELQLLTSMPYNQKYQYKFTYANFEAAMAMTKRIWYSRCHFKKAKDNIAYVIIPMCFDVLYTIAKIFDGTYAAEEVYNEKLEAWGEVNEGKSDSWWEGELEPSKHSDNTAKLVHKSSNDFVDFCKSYDEKQAEGYAPTIPIIAPEDILPEIECEEPMEVDEVEELRPATVEDMSLMFEAIEEFADELEQKEQEEKERILEEYYPKDEPDCVKEKPVPFVNEKGQLEMSPLAEIKMFDWNKPEEGWKIIRKKQKWERNKIDCDWPFKFYPKLTKLPFKHAKHCKAETEFGVIPLYTPEEMKRNFYENLPEVYLRIGRPELAERACCMPAKLFWKQQLKRYGMLNDNTWMNTLYERLHEIGRTRNVTPPNTPAEELDLSHAEQLLGNLLEEDEEAEELLPERVRTGEFCPGEVRRNIKVPGEREAQSAEGPGTPNLGASAPTGGGKTGGTVTGGEQIEKPVKSGEKHVTMTFVDQREVQEAGAKQVKKQREEDHAVQEIYSMLNVMKRPQLIGKVTWNTADERRKELVRYVVPYAYFSANSTKPEVCEPLTASYVLSMFGAAKFDMKVRMVINSVKFQQGRLLGVFVPFYKTDRSDFNLECLTNYPHAFIDASVSNSVEIAIPWTSVRDSFPIYTDPHHEISYFGTFHVFVWNALNTGQNGSSDTGVSIYMWLENIEVYQLTNPKAPSVVSFANQVIPDVSLVRSNTLRHIPAKQRQPAVERVPQAGMGSLIEGMSELAMETGANAMERMLQSLIRGEKSKPAGFMPPQPVVPWIAANGSHGEGVDLSQRLCLEPMSATRPDKSMSKPHNIKDLTNEWSRIAVQKWSVNDEENVALVTLPVCPMIPSMGSAFKKVEMHGGVVWTKENVCNTIDKEYNFSVEERYPSLLDYLSLAYHYWRGSLKFRFEVVKTSMHSGRVYVRYEPYGNLNSAKKECEKQATPGWVWDIQEKSVIDVEVPFTSMQPYLSTLWHPQPGAISWNLVGNVACGLIELAVLNRLKVTTGIADFVEINVYLAGGDDFEFFAPRPLEGVLQLRNWDRNVVTAEKADWYQDFWDMIGEWWKEIARINYGSNTPAWEIIQRNGKKYAQIIQDQAGIWRIPGRSGTAGANWTYLANGMKTILPTCVEKKIFIPKFADQVEAYQWLNNLPARWPAHFQKLFDAWSWKPTPMLWDKFVWCTTLLVMQNMAHRMTFVPMTRERVGDQWYNLFVHEIPDPPPKEDGERVPQSNEKASGPGINPFTVFRPNKTSTKELSGENHMDMYKMMKRFCLWATASIPPDLNVYQDAVEWKKQEFGDLLYELRNMSSWESSEYMWEFRFPVTPMTQIHNVGDNRAWLQDEGGDKRKYAGADGLPNSTIDSGVAIGTMSGMTYTHFFGKLFTFWKGSMRYRFTFPDVNTEKPHWMTVVYSPEEFSNPPPGLWKWRIANAHQYRQNTQLGTVLMNGNIMANVDVEVPFYSQYSRLYCTDTYYDKISTSGSIIIYVPLNYLQKDVCLADGTNSVVYGNKMWIWTAVGDDFEFQVPRQAPVTVLWPKFTQDMMDWDHFHTAYDKLIVHKSDRAIMEKHTTNKIHLELSNDYENEIKSLEQMMGMSPLHYRKADSDIQRMKRTIIGKDATLQNSWASTEKEDGKRVAQAGEEELSVRPKEVTLQGDDELDGIISTTVTGLKKFTTVMDSLEKVVDPFVTKITALTDKCNISLETVTQEVKESAGAVKTGVEYAINGTRIGMFFYGIHQMLQAETWQERWIPLATCALSLGLSPSVVTQAGEWVVSNASTILSSEKVNERKEPQAWEDMWNNDIGVFLQEHSCTLRMIAAGIVTILTFYMTPNLPSTARVKSFAVDMVNKLRNMAFIGAGLKSLEWMFKWVSSVIKEGAMWVADTFSGGLITANRLSAHYPEVLEWLRNVEKYDVEGFKAPLAYDHGARVELWKLIDKGKDLNNKLASRSGPLYHTITRGMVKLNKLDSESTSLKNAPPFRMDPIHICFVGEAGVKKSSILTYILNFVADELGYPVTNRFYARNEAEEHWNGYCGQLITLIDDLGQIKDGKAVEELISMKSNIAWHVPMAHLEDKGKSFASKIIGSTTNIPFPKPANINHHNALWRRRNVLIEVVQMHVFGDTTTNKWSHLRFNLLDPFPGQGADTKNYIRMGLTLTDLMVFLVETVKKWEQKQHALVYAGLQGKVFDLPEFQDAKEVVRPCKTFFEEVLMSLRNGTVYTRERLEKILNGFTLDQVRTILSDKEAQTALHLTPEWDTLNAIYVLVDRADNDINTALRLTDKHDKRTYLEVLRNGPMKGYISMIDDDFGCPIEVYIMKGAKIYEHYHIDWPEGRGKDRRQRTVKKKKEDEEEFKSCDEVDTPKEVKKDLRNTKSLLEEMGEESVDDGDDVEYEEDNEHLRHLVNDERVPQGMHEDVNELIQGGFSMYTEDWEALKMKAQESLRKREELITSFEDIVERVCAPCCEKKRVRVTNKDEMKTFVSTYYPMLTTTEQDKLVDQFSEAFDRVHKNETHWAEFAANEQTIDELKQLFEEKYSKFWLKDEKNVWRISAADESEEGVTAYMLYMLLKEKYSEKAISDMKEQAPDASKYKISQVIQVVQKFYETQKSKMVKWFEEHPVVFKMLKLAGAIAGIFVGYKLVNWVCPTIVEKIKLALASLFGWGVSKIGEERVERWKGKGRELATWGKEKVRNSYEYVKSLMMSSDDAEVREWAEDPDCVQLYAESLERMEAQAKTAVAMKLRTLSPESKTKKKVMNAYMLGQDKVQEALQKTKPESRLSVQKEVRVYEPQGCSDENAKRLRDNVLSKNMVRAHWASAVKSVTMNGVFLKNRYLLIPYHFWDGCAKGQSFVLYTRVNQCMWEVFDPSLCRKIAGSDMSIYLCSKRIGNFTDLTKHFPTEVNVSQTPAALMSMTADCMFTVQPVHAYQVSDVEYKLSSGEMVSNLYAWEYEAMTDFGDCGSVLVADNAGITKKILGIHICGVKGKNVGNAVYISLNDINDVFEQLPDDSAVKPTCYVPQCLITKGVDAMKIKPFGNFDLHGAVDRKHEVQLPHKTEILPSPIHDLVREHVTEPSVLVQSDPRLKVPGSPLLRAIEKYGKPTIPFPKEDLNLAFNHIESEVMYWKRPHEPRLLTDWEAVFGNEMIDYCDRMNLGASPGYPWTLSRPSGEKGKAYLFDVNSEDGIQDPEFRKHYQLREALAKEGIRKVSVWTDCLKDERRPIAKIESGKTRAFMLPPADYVMLCRKYLMMFNVTFYSNRITSFSAVGLDPYSFEWTRLVRKLKKNSNLAFGGDFHSFDGIFDAEFMWRICKLINKWYRKFDPQWKEEDDVVRQVLFEEMIHTVHICKNSIYEKHQGNPSGNPETVVVNTIAHYVYLLLAWIGLARKYSPENMTLQSFSKSVSAIFYGDDGLYTVKLLASDWFNCKTVSEYLADFGIEYTDESKSTELYGVKPLYECTFLKNGFSKLPGSHLWLAPISKDTIFELTNWVRKSDDPINQLRANLADVFAFALHHGETFFRELSIKVNEALESRGLKTFPVSYEHEMERFLAKCWN